MSRLDVSVSLLANVASVILFKHPHENLMIGTSGARDMMLLLRVVVSPPPPVFPIVRSLFALKRLKEHLCCSTRAHMHQPSSCTADCDNASIFCDMVCFL